MRKRTITLHAASAMTLLALTAVPLAAVASGSPLPEPQAKATAGASTVTGTVLDEDGEPLIGVTVMTDEKTGTTTDIDGNFSIKVKKFPANLTFTYVGMQTQTVKVASASPLSVTLKSNATALDDVVVVGYGTQKKETMTGSVAAIGSDIIKQTSTANLTTALAGRMPGLTTLQTSGQPGVDDVNIYLRGAATTNGQSPLILIDGVPRDDIATLDPNEVQSVSILKDASATAVFGVRGANGVILVTTRRGESGKAQVSVSANVSIQDFIHKPTRVHSWEWAELRNTAYSNDGFSGDQLPYTDWMIDMYKSGEDPNFYPDFYAYDYMFKKWAPQERVNLNINGGTDRVKYFINVGYLGQQGQLKTEDKKNLNYDPSFNNDRFNIRSNLDFTIFSNLKLSLNVASYLGKINSPGKAGLFNSRNHMVNEAMLRIWEYAPTNPAPLTAEGYVDSNGTPVQPGQIVQQKGLSPGRNIYGDLNRRGYMHEVNMRLESSIVLDWGLDFITKGLSTKFMAAFDNKAQTVREGVKMTDAYDVEVPRTAETYGNRRYAPINVNTNDVLKLSKSTSALYYLNMQYSINYNRSFGNHDVTAMALVQRDNWQKSAADLPYNMLGVAGRVTYGYDSRYLAEVNVGYNGSEQFAKGHRFGLFPAFSLGWLVSNEKFLQDQTFISYLKLRGSYGKVGNDKLGDARFLYMSNIAMVDGSGINISSLGNGQYVDQTKFGNPNIGWEIAYKQNYGIDATIFGNDLTLSLDYFREHRKDILINRASIPQINGRPLGNIPKVNMGVVDNQGFEIDATYRKRLNKDFSFSVNGNFAYNENKVKEMDETTYGDGYVYKNRVEGYSLGQCWGYQIDYSNGNGYINTADELAWAKDAYAELGAPRLGDFKYVDLNDDGIINDKDKAPIGYSSIPRITYGFGLTANYRGFDISAQFQGTGKFSGTYAGTGVYETGSNGFYSGYHLNAWTQERYESGAKIEYPALSNSANVNHHSNSFFIFDRSFLRLKNIEVGYNLPKSVLNALTMQQMRLFVSANNIVTWHHMRSNCIDPEQASYLSYPITKMWTFGLNVTF